MTNPDKPSDRSIIERLNSIIDRFMLDFFAVCVTDLYSAALRGAVWGARVSISHLGRQEPDSLIHLSRRLP